MRGVTRRELTDLSCRFLTRGGSGSGVDETDETVESGSASLRVGGHGARGRWGRDLMRAALAEAEADARGESVRGSY